MTDENSVENMETIRATGQTEQRKNQNCFRRIQNYSSPDLFSLPTKAGLGKSWAVQDSCGKPLYKDFT